MSESNQTKGSIVDLGNLPKQYPTHRHAPQFWEGLGRTIATFGFLEEVLGKAIFSFSATQKYEESEIETAFERWLPTLKIALSDPLGNLIRSYVRAVSNNSSATITNLNLEELAADLRRASEIRNVLCHGSWRLPDEAGRSIPFFVNRHMEVFETAVDVLFLQQTQQHVVELASAVISTVTHMGWQFPGSNGPGDSIMAKKM